FLVPKIVVGIDILTRVLASGGIGPLAVQPERTGLTQITDLPGPSLQHIEHRAVRLKNGADEDLSARIIRVVDVLRVGVGDDAVAEGGVADGVIRGQRGPLDGHRLQVLVVEEGSVPDAGDALRDGEGGEGGVGGAEAALKGGRADGGEGVGKEKGLYRRVVKG